MEKNKSFDALSRNNRIFLDALIRLIAVELTCKSFDTTWYDVQLPFYVGSYKGELQISGKTSISFKSALQVLNKKQIDIVNEILLVNHPKKLSKTEIYNLFENYFNNSTLSCLNDWALLLKR